jgi:hypothetical protein
MDNLKNMKADHYDKVSKEKAKKMLGDQGSAPDVIYSKSCADKEKMRPFKKGGIVKKNCK